jgi:cyclohexadienyl dehydratase
VSLGVATGCREPAPQLPALRVATSGDYAPFSLKEEGFDIDVARRLAGDLGYRIDWVPFRWAELAGLARAGGFDVAMSGVTWQPERDVAGYLSRAVAAGGPCVLGGTAAPRIAVNRGGFLEGWARARFADREIRAVAHNVELPDLLGKGEVDAIVTDRFELPFFTARLVAGGQRAVECSPPRYRKVYWVSPAQAGELGPRIDAWLAAHEPDLGRLRERWWGASDARAELDHLVDLLARRLAFMPAVAACKRARGLPIEDLAQEARVLEAAARGAQARGLDPASVRELFRVQIELAKAVQGRAAERPVTLDLESEIRPALARLGERIADSLAALAPIGDARLRGALDVLLEETLEPSERSALESALRGVRRASGADLARASD